MCLLRGAHGVRGAGLLYVVVTAAAAPMRLKVLRWLGYLVEAILRLFP